MSSLLVLVLAAGPSATWPDAGKPVSGYVETVRLYPGGLALPAKVDTGADRSSLNAVDVERFDRDARTWVRFTVANDQGRSVLVERPVIGTARIRRHAAPVEERDVLMLGICLGNVYKDVEVNIVDRSRLRYPLLVGRNFLGDDFLVDPSATNLLAPSCTGKTDG